MNGRVRRFVCITLLLALTLLPGCGRREATVSGFVIGEDWQYQYMDEFPQNQKLAEDEDGAVYFMSGSYLFRYDPANGTTLPLCNRPNCLHNAETDADRRESCHAYLPLASSVEKSGGGVAYCRGEIIVYYPEKGTTDGAVRVDAITRDGGARRMVRRLTNAPESFAVHRGRIYFSYFYYDEEGQNHTEVGSFDLSGGGVEVIYEAPLQAHSGPILLFPIGNAVYFAFFGNLQEGETSRSFLFRYDIHEKTSREVALPEMDVLGYISNIAGLKDRILVDALYPPESEGGKVRHVLYALDTLGNFPELFAEDVPSRFYSDGERVYLSESASKEAEWVANLELSDVTQETINSNTSTSEMQPEGERMYTEGEALAEGGSHAEGEVHAEGETYTEDETFIDEEKFTEKETAEKGKDGFSSREDTTCQVTILDEKGKKVGTFLEERQATSSGMPYYDICVGVGTYGYLLQQISAYGGSVLYRVDKSLLEGLQGGHLPMEKVSEIFLSPADQEMIGNTQGTLKVIPGYIYEKGQIGPSGDALE